MRLRSAPGITPAGLDQALLLELVEQAHEASSGRSRAIGDRPESRAALLENGPAPSREMGSRGGLEGPGRTP